MGCQMLVEMNCASLMIATVSTDCANVRTKTTITPEAAVNPQIWKVLFTRIAVLSQPINSPDQLT
jgi:hypothetical protein